MTGWEIIFYWLLPILAIVYVLVHSALFQPVREHPRLPKLLYVLLDCPMCTGAWVGLLVGFINCIPVAWPRWVQYPVLGLLSAIAIQYLLELFGRRRG